MFRLFPNVICTNAAEIAVSVMCSSMDCAGLGVAAHPAFQVENNFQEQLKQLHTAEDRRPEKQTHGATDIRQEPHRLKSRAHNYSQSESMNTQNN